MTNMKDGCCLPKTLLHSMETHVISNFAVSGLPPCSMVVYHVSEDVAYFSGAV